MNQDSNRKGYSSSAAGRGFSFIILLVLLVPFLFASCDEYKPIVEYLQHGEDTLYIVLYADSSNFSNVFYIDTVYRKSRDNYSFPPSLVDSKLLTGERPNKPHFDKSEYFARVIGFTGSSVFYTSPVHRWVSRETTLDEIKRSPNEHRKTVTLKTPEGSIEVPVDSLK